jgi:hypothetical protein
MQKEVKMGYRIGSFETLKSLFSKCFLQQLHLSIWQLNLVNLCPLVGYVAGVNKALIATPSDQITSRVPTDYTQEILLLLWVVWFFCLSK